MVWLWHSWSDELNFTMQVDLILKKDEIQLRPRYCKHYISPKRTSILRHNLKQVIIKQDNKLNFHWDFGQLLKTYFSIEEKGPGQDTFQNGLASIFWSVNFYLNLMIVWSENTCAIWPTWVKVNIIFLLLFIWPTRVKVNIIFWPHLIKILVRLS